MNQFPSLTFLEIPDYYRSCNYHGVSPQFLNPFSIDSAGFPCVQGPRNSQSLQFSWAKNHCKKFPVSVWLALVALDSLTDAGPVPENRGKSPPKEVQNINKWLGEDKNSDILKDILEIAKNGKAVKKNIKDIKQNKNDVKGN